MATQDVAFLGAIGGLGAIGIWRYGWWLTQIVRAWVYLHRVFPQLRAAASVSLTAKTPHLYILVSSYRIPPHQTAQVFRALIEDCRACGSPATILASVTAAVDEETICDVYELLGAPPGIQIVVKFQQGDGKRSALGFALRSVARRGPDSDDLVVFLDGDVVIEAGAIAKCAALFTADPQLRAVTTNNDAVVEEGWILRRWYGLRHAQRHVLMASMALSERLLVLTGRLSLFRAGDAVSREFIDLVERDEISHWRLGRLAFVSGDDKSTWYYVLKNHGKMLYVPDVKAVSFEHLPQGRSFLAGTGELMQRWYGNMLRANGRAIRLGPQVCGPFTWWCLVDQRLSMWTSLIGSTAALLLALRGMLLAPVFYLLWVLVTRTLMALVAGLLWGRFHASWPFLMFFSQVWGAWLRIYILFRLDRQGWTRQGIGLGSRASGADAVAGVLLHVAALAAFVLFVSGGLGLIPRFGSHLLPALRLVMAP